MDVRGAWDIVYEFTGPEFRAPFWEVPAEQFVVFSARMLSHWEPAERKRERDANQRIQLRIGQLFIFLSDLSDQTAFVQKRRTLTNLNQPY